jgi:hypothetical protein
MFDLVTRCLRAPGGLCLGLGLLGLLAAAQANAACMDSLKKIAPVAQANPGRFTPALYRSDDLFGGTLMQVNDDGAEVAPIVGLWKFKTSGFVKDFGLQAFNAGGTELMFSGGVDPSTGDTCQGVWRRVGQSTYTLNHIAMAWTAPGAGYALLVHFHMVIRLAPSGNAFTGNYTVSLFSETSQDPFNESAGPFVSGAGTVTASRVQPD